MCIIRQSRSERCCIRPVHRPFPPLKSQEDLIGSTRRYGNLKTTSARAQVSSYCSRVTQLDIFRFGHTFNPGIPGCFLRPELSRHFSINCSFISSPKTDDISVCLPFVSLDDVCSIHPRLLGQKPGFRHALVHPHHLLQICNTISSDKRIIKYSPLYNLYFVSYILTIHPQPPRQL